MNYDWLSYEEIKKYKYPNLLAELKESGYSICTVGDHLGMGRYRQEDDPEIWGKLRNGKFDAGEAINLAELFGVKLEYLFSNELKTAAGVAVAKTRWARWNDQKENMLRVEQLKWELKQELEELDVEAIRRVSRAWTDGMRKEGIPDSLIAFCNKLAEVVIAQKLANS